MSCRRFVRHAAAIVVLTLTAQTQAQSFNIDFDGASGSGAGVPNSAYGAAAAQSGVWNSIIFTFTNPGPFALFDLSGNPSGVTVTQSGLIGSINFTQSATSGNFKLLLDDAVFATGAYSLRIDGLLPGSYTVYTYAISPTGSGGFERNGISVAGSASPSPQSIGGPIPASVFANGLTHAIHTVNVAAGSPLVINAAPWGGNGYINGIQIVRTFAAVAELNTPADGACVCGNVSVFGTAANIASYTLDYASTLAGPWTVISTRSQSVINGVLGTWNTTSLAEGAYYLRLTSTTLGGQPTTVQRRVVVTRNLPTADIVTPLPNTVVGGRVPLAGAAGDVCLASYQLFSIDVEGIPVEVPIDPAQTQGVGQGVLSIWNTTALPDSTYDVRLRARDNCNNTASDTVRLIVDNTPPTAALDLPSGTVDICRPIVIFGTALDENFASWTLDYISETSPQWRTIATGTGQTENDELAEWDIRGLPLGAYTLRLRVSDRAQRDGVPNNPNRGTATASILLGGVGDVNGDGTVNGADLAVILARFGSTCN